MLYKSIFLIVDALRYDLISSQKVRKKLFPAFDKIIKRGFLKKAVANAQSTQFVLPSLFSSSYPLDYGGYNYGIRDRKSYIQDIKKRNTRTYLMSTCNQMGIGNGYDKGFDEVYTTNDYRLIIEHKINRTLIYEINLFKKKIKSKQDTIQFLQKEFGITLDRIISYKSLNNELWPPKLRKINNQVLQNSIAEKELLFKKPDIILKKMQKVSGGMYWHTLGKIKYNSIYFQINRVMVAINWRAKKIIAKQNLWPFFRLGHHAVIINDIIDSLINKILNIKEKSWHIHMHFMDVHDHRATNNTLNLIKRFRFYPKWLIERIRGNIKHRFLYVAATMDLDQNLGKLLNKLEEHKIIDDMLFLITADHASYYPESPRKKLDVAQRTHYEDLEIPFILANTKSKPIENTMCDSMDICTTFVTKLGIKIGSRYKGKDICSEKKFFVISENCGSGNADIKRRDVYFTISTKKFRLMVTLNKKKLIVEKLFDKYKDPFEIINIKTHQSYKNEINKLIKILYENRKKVFEIKGIRKIKLINN